MECTARFRHEIRQLRIPISILDQCELSQPIIRTITIIVQGSAKRLRELAPPPAARGSQEAGFTQPVGSSHLLVYPYTPLCGEAS